MSAAATIQQAERRPSSRYIAGPTFDWLIFIGSPLLALALGVTVSGSALSNRPFEWNGQTFTWAGLLLGIVIHGHLGAVFFRSHGNPRIFKRYPYRFLSIPVFLFAAMLASPLVLICVSVLATFWDVYHSALQTFGFARIYDAKAGNPPDAGRKLDWWLNQLLYCGPILAGATMLDHFEDFREFEAVGVHFFSRIPVVMEAEQASYAWLVVGAGTLFLLYYLFAQWQLQRAGHRISREKVALLAGTGFVSIYTWGFNSWGEAFLIMNLFHAVQYFGIVWTTERGNMQRLFRVEGSAMAGPGALAVFLFVSLGYGFFAEASPPNMEWIWALTLVVSIMHFWYDGFVWSVSRNEV